MINVKLGFLRAIFAVFEIVFEYFRTYLAHWIISHILSDHFTNFTKEFSTHKIWWKISDSPILFYDMVKMGKTMKRLRLSLIPVNMALVYKGAQLMEYYRFPSFCLIFDTFVAESSFLGKHDHVYMPPILHL